MFIAIGRVIYILMGVVTMMWTLDRAEHNWEHYCVTKDELRKSMALVCVAQVVWIAAAIAQIFE